MKLPFLLITTLIAPTVLITTAKTQTIPVKETKPFLHSLFTDNAVLQRDRAIPVWGWTTPGQIVTVKLDEKTTSARADNSGRWVAKIGPYPAGGPHTLTVSEGGDAPGITRSNILFGDVWFCSGQSNMEMGLTMVNDAQQEIAAANYPGIRLYTVPKGTSASPLSDVKSQWLPCTPANVAAGGWGGFSAVAYFFGRKLNQELKVPIGLIHSSWGGTEAESWVSASSLGTLPDFRPQIAQVQEVAAAGNVSYETRLTRWLATNDKGGWADWSAPDLNDRNANWFDILTPAQWEGSGVSELRNFDGIGWYRREVDVPAAWAGGDLTLRLGIIDDNDITYWNGVAVGSNVGWGTDRRYKIPGAQVKAGRNIIAVRVTDTGGGGGISGNANDVKLERSATESIPLAGTWKFHISVSNDQLKSAPLQIGADNPHVPTVLYNAMVAPLEPFALKGAIWYQGENNADRPAQYERLLPTLIKDWRTKFDSPLPFHIVQLAGFMAPDDAPRTDNWPLLRAAQMKTAATVPRTGIVVTTDIGDEKDIHPKDKQDVGLRLALSALAKDYGRKVEYTGPVLKSLSPQGANLALIFNHAEGGLSFKGDEKRAFAVAGTDHNWFWANPRIDGTKVILSSPFVPNPVYVRFAWSNLPSAALYNGANLPAAPFEVTDSK
jgi:sialate O-acetylesterase